MCLHQLIARIAVIMPAVCVYILIVSINADVYIGTSFLSSTIINGVCRCTYVHVLAYNWALWLGDTHAQYVYLHAQSNATSIRQSVHRIHCHVAMIQRRHSGTVHEHSNRTAHYTPPTLCWTVIHDERRRTVTGEVMPQLRASNQHLAPGRSLFGLFSPPGDLDSGRWFPALTSPGRLMALLRIDWCVSLTRTVRCDLS